MNKIAIFYHGLFYLGDPPELNANALHVVCEQMDEAFGVGLIRDSSKFLVGLNGGVETGIIANLLIPSKAEVVLHGLQSRSENLTLVEIEKWIKSIPESEEWYVLYFHAKGCTHPLEDKTRGPWRKCMMRNIITEWRKCVKDLDSGWDSVGCHWSTPPKTPPGQYIWAGNFWWARSSFLKTLPSIYERSRIKDSGIDSLESRYESEVWIGNGPRQPSVMDYCKDWWPGKPHVNPKGM